MDGWRKVSESSGPTHNVLMRNRFDLLCRRRSAFKQWEKKRLKYVQHELQAGAQPQVLDPYPSATTILLKELPAHRLYDANLDPHGKILEKIISLLRTALTILLVIALASGTVMLPNPIYTSGLASARARAMNCRSASEGAQPRSGLSKNQL